MVTLGPVVGSDGDDGCVRSNPVCEEWSQKLDGEPMTALRCCSVELVDAILVAATGYERYLVGDTCCYGPLFMKSLYVLSMRSYVDIRPLSSCQTRQELRHIQCCGVISLSPR